MSAKLAVMLAALAVGLLTALSVAASEFAAAVHHLWEVPIGIAGPFAAGAAVVLPPLLQKKIVNKRKKRTTPSQPWFVPRAVCDYRDVRT